MISETTAKISEDEAEIELHSVAVYSIQIGGVNEKEPEEPCGSLRLGLYVRRWLSRAVLV